MRTNESEHIDRQECEDEGADATRHLLLVAGHGGCAAVF